MFKHTVFGLAAGLLSITGTQASGLSARKAATVTFLRPCATDGPGFFYIPGTDTCLKVGGFALLETRIFNMPYSIGDGFYSRSGPGVLKPGIGEFGSPGSGPSGDDYRNARSRDTYGLGATGRVELDGRMA